MDWRALIGNFGRGVSGGTRQIDPRVTQKVAQGVGAFGKMIGRGGAALGRKVMGQGQPAPSPFPSPQQPTPQGPQMDPRILDAYLRAKYPGQSSAPMQSILPTPMPNQVSDQQQPIIPDEYELMKRLGGQ